MGKKDIFINKEPNEATGFLLWKAHNFWQREIKKSLKQYNLTHTQFVILANAHWLSQHNKVVTQVQIAKQAETDVVMTSNVIRTLERKEMLVREESKYDTRAKQVTLTKLGFKTLKMALHEVESFDQEFFSRLQKTKKFNKELVRLLGAEE